MKQNTCILFHHMHNPLTNSYLHIGAIAVCAFALSLAPANAAAPSNDNFAARSLLPENQAVSGSTIGATNEAGEPNPFTATVWYEYTAYSTGTASFNVVTSNNKSNQVQLFIGDDLGNLTLLKSSGLTNNSRITSIVTSGVQYYVRVMSGVYAGDFSLLAYNDSTGYDEAAFSGVGSKSANDNFDQAVFLFGDNVKSVGYQQGATRQAGEPAESGEGTLWWQWIATSDGTTTFSTAGSEGIYNKYLVIGTGTSVAALNYRYTHGRPASGTIKTTAGTIYYIAVGAAGQSNTSAVVLSILHTPDYGNGGGTNPGGSGGNYSNGGTFAKHKKKLSAHDVIRGRFYTPALITRIKVKVDGAASIRSLNYNRRTGAFSFVSVKRGSSGKPSRVTYTVSAYLKKQMVAVVRKRFVIR